MADNAKKLPRTRSENPLNTPRKGAGVGVSREKLAAEWQKDNRAALAAHAEFIERHGTLAERLKALG